MTGSWALFALFIGIAVVMALIFIAVTVRKEGGRKQAGSAIERMFDVKSNKRKWNLLLQWFYVRCYRTPVLKLYIRRIRKRLEILHAYDEYVIRRETMSITLLTLAITITVTLLILLLIGNAMAIPWILLGVIVSHGILVDTFVNKSEDRLLKQTVILLEDVRHHYQQTKNVEEAIYAASETLAHPAGKHAERVYEVLTAEDQEQELETYYEVAPNRYFRLFAGISYLVAEYGDRNIRTGSMFLNALAKLVQEINYEIMRRDKLNYLLKGLAVIAIAPVLALYPLESWARTYFPIMADFYESKTGMIVKVLFFAVVLASYLVIRKMLEYDEARYAAQGKRLKWEQWLYKQKPVSVMIDRLVPSPHKRLHFQLSTLLKQANSQLTLEWLYVQRVLLCVVSFAVTAGLFVYLHAAVKHDVLHDPLRNMGIFGVLSEDEKQKAEERTAFDREMLQQLQDQKDVTKDRVIEAVSVQTDTDRNELSVIQTAQRIFDKYNIVHSEYFKWWELIVAIAAGIVAYHSPVWLIQFQRRMRQIEMQNEVDQFHTIISILAEFERISVETIMEWMERFSLIFRDSIKNGLNQYSSGALEALEQIKLEAPFVPYIRIIEKLQLAVEKIPVKDAFDDLEMAREYYMEKRKEHNSRVIEQKASFGKIVGFVPFGYIVFLDLVLPMLYLSVVQMGQSMRSISGI
ncbi:hypothetical protein [Paenibacillus harenae]|uniref:Type II secretion system protein GspF domain-containing protein n=1 Tax=Paenibacillus harenae TaxID=306543 RepID=A0ABT9TTH6_PAEHA|nr:hypothetical protein [Paenibacillus harenae]MDQ0110655.1 hypothetical protein [Paenibacillus harenae]